LVVLVTTVGVCETEITDEYQPRFVC